MPLRHVQQAGHNLGNNGKQDVGNTISTVAFVSVTYVNVGLGRQAVKSIAVAQQQRRQLVSQHVVVGAIERGVRNDPVG